MPRQTNLRVLMYCFALFLHAHACVLLAPSFESVIACVGYVCNDAIRTESGATL